MTKFLFLLILLFCQVAPAQGLDTLVIPSTDDTIRTEDSTLAQDSTIAQDTTGIFDSKITQTAVDTIFPVSQRTAYIGSTFYGQEALKDLYSTYEANSLQESERIFVRDYAFLGYPDQIYYYGTNSVNLLDDGLALNNIFGYANTNHIMMESVDSIEFIPATRGLLYGQSFQQTSINFISKDFLSASPYTRVRYYEGLEREGMLSGIFNTLIFNRINFYVDLTNRSGDPRYTNSDLSSWQGKFKLKFLLSEKVNILTSYNFNHFFSGYNGGVDMDSIRGATSNIGNVLYDEILAPVVYPTRQLEDIQHLFRLRMLALPSDNLYSDFNIYYSASNIRFFANEDFNASDFLYKAKTLGAYFEQRYQQNIFTAELRADYNHSDIRVNNYFNPLIDFIYQSYSVSAAGYVSLFDSTLIPSLYYRFGNTSIHDNDDNQSGAGGDLTFRPLDFLSVYGGWSFYNNLFDTEDLTGTQFQAGLSANYSFINFRGEFYSRRNYNHSDELFLNQYPVDVNHSGINALAEFRVWSLLLTSSINYPFNPGGAEVTGLPRIVSRSGLFFKDYLFSGNLDLKTGFVFNYWGEQFLMDDRRRIAFAPHYIEEAYRIDFTFSAEIQESAILFFTWENITDNKFYLTPFYPMPFSSFKFGVAWELFN